MEIIVVISTTVRGEMIWERPMITDAKVGRNERKNKKMLIS